MNIYYIKEGSGLYYDNIFNAFQLNNNFNFVKDLSFADALILGPGFLSDEGLKRNENTIIKSGVKKNSISEQRVQEFRKKDRIY